ncbi:hypothetical protein [Halobacteriovorax sp. HLS]|uniref:hypothetical protein n=1 Tax=Halobacteriovorax sp. HLS TaxID=2234000 RepID=UPI000FDBE888|nr:hypothetical protein [Halobacteriovorax sp. HLS]
MSKSSEYSGDPNLKGKQIFTVESFEKLPPKQFRTAGVKGGKKDSFSSQTKHKSGNGSQGSSASSKTQQVNEQALKQLAASSKAGLDSKPQEVERPIERTKKVNENSQFTYTAKEPMKQKLQRQQQQLQGEVLQKLAASPYSGNAIAGKGFNIQFEPPEGVPEDELNSAEKIYFSFQKRTYEKYVNSFVKTYYEILRSNPIIKDAINNQRHRLNGRVTFDSNGYIIAVKIMRSSQSDEIHKLFEKTLDQMRSIPNPPKDLVQKDGTFTIYYSLYIN